MERTIRLVIGIGAVALLVADLAISRAWSSMMLAGTGAFLFFALFASVSRHWIAVVLLSSCLFPPLVWFTLDTFAVQFWPLWIAALLGGMSPAIITRPWRMAPRWRGPLIMVSLATLVATPIVVARELDFNPALLDDVPFAVLSGLPRFSIEWVLQTALVTVTGVLWFDWLMASTDDDIETLVIQPLVLSIGACALVAVYQMLRDITFLNPTVYGALGRAAGTMFDANVSGMLGAVGIGLVFRLADSSPRRVAWLSLLPVFGLSVWASGSRTASGAAVIVLLSILYPRWRRRSRATLTARAAVIGAAIALTVLLVGAVLIRGTTAVGPLARFARMRPSVSGASTTDALAELWRRNGYGTASSRLIQRYPWAGIGIGGFHQFGPPLSAVGRLPPDNAQNWLRHQVVELGVLGSVGWMLFVVSFGVFVVRGWRGERDRGFDGLRGVLLAFGAISLFGMPTQEVVVAALFWTVAAAFARPRSSEAAVAARAPLSRWVVPAIVLVTAAFGISTWRDAQGALRVPVRARQIGWPYEYGFYPPEPDGSGGVMRWTTRRATALVDVGGSTMHIAIRAPLPHVETDPVRVTVWCEGKRAIDTLVRSGDPVSASVRLPDGLIQTLIDVRVSRTARPRDLDKTSADDRELGAMVSWSFSRS